MGLFGAIPWGKFFQIYGGWIALLAETAFLMLFLFLTKSVSIPMWKARTKGQPLVLLQRKDERYGLVTGKYEQGGIDLKKWGFFITGKGQFKPFGGTTLAQAKEGFAAFPTPEYAEATNKLKEAGYDNLEDALAAEDELRAKAEEGDIVSENILGHLSDVEDFATMGMSPAHLREKIDHEVQKKMKRQQDNPMAKLLMYAIAAAVIIIPILALVYYGKCPDCTTLCRGTAKAASTAVNM